MEIKKIEFIKTKPIRIQVNNLKKILIENNVILGKKFTFEIATLILQTEKLINYYDSKKLLSRFNSNFRALELTLSNEDISFEDVSKFINQLSLIKTEFNNVKTNEQKKCIMFKLLFFHINVLFNAYQSKELKINDSVIEKPKLKTNNSVENPTNKSNESLEKLTDKQRKKYLELSNKLENAEPSQRNKIQAGLTYYKNLMRK